MSNKIKVILDRVLDDVIPDSSCVDVANSFVGELNSLLKKHNILAVAVLGGSMAKNTFLRGDSDADVFVKFDFSYKGGDISSLLFSLLKKEGFVFDRVKGSRDYFHVRKDILFELVPVLDVSNIVDADNVIDMSPLHVDYFKKKGVGLENDVRLLKKFMKANRVYGAESFIRGFSGHVVDLLVIKYGSFLNVLRAASKWSGSVVIDIEHKLKNPLLELDKAKVSGPLVLVDPVQDNRNAAAALDFVCFNRFVGCAKAFLSNPSFDFFVFKDALSIVSSFKKDSDFLLEFLIEPVKGSDDISGSKVLKLLHFINLNLKESGFLVSGFEWDFGFPSKCYFLVDSSPLQSRFSVRGPPLSQEDHCVVFKSKHEDVFVRDGFLFAWKSRVFLDVFSYLDFLIKDVYISERCVSIKFSKI